MNLVCHLNPKLAARVLLTTIQKDQLVLLTTYLQSLHSISAQVLGFQC